MKIKLRHVDVLSDEENQGSLEVATNDELCRKLRSMAVYSLSKRGPNGNVIMLSGMTSQ